VGILSGDSLKSVGMVSGLVVTLWQGWDAGRKARQADSRAGQVQAYAVTSSVQRSRRLDSLSAVVEEQELEIAALARRLTVMERKRRIEATAKVYGPEPAPEWYAQPERRGFFSRLFGR
jgi:hypothetical protein